MSTTTDTTKKALFGKTSGKHRGYDTEQVEAFISRARETYDGKSSDPLKSEEIRQASFRLAKHGYRPAQVDAALDRLEDVFFAREQRERVRQQDTVAFSRERRALSHEILGRASRPRKKRFRRRSFLARGYKKSQVDSFLDRIADAIGGSTTMSPTTVRETLFRAQWGGYDEAQVDAYLDATVVLLLEER